MADLSHRQLILCVAVAAAIVLVGVRQLAAAPEPSPASARQPAIRVEAAPRGRVVVHVAGAVRRPGVYRMPASARVDDAVQRAGGPTRGGDLAGLNLAAKVQDGRQVLVPLRSAQPTAGDSGTSRAGTETAATGAAGAPVNLNTATPEQLDLLVGVGPATVQKIIAYREEHGGFGSVEELAQVPGIGEKRMTALRELVGV